MNEAVVYLYYNLIIWINYALISLIAIAINWKSTANRQG